jgi:hypothetical protein
MTEEDDKVTILQAQSLTLKTSKNQREKREKNFKKPAPYFDWECKCTPFFHSTKKNFYFFDETSPLTTP